MTVLADRMIRFGLKNLEQIMPEKPVAGSSVARIGYRELFLGMVVGRPMHC